MAGGEQEASVLGSEAWCMAATLCWLWMVASPLPTRFSSTPLPLLHIALSLRKECD